MRNLVVFVSGDGTNLQVIIDAIESGYLIANILAVISNNPEAYALIRAQNHEIPNVCLSWNKEVIPSREEYDQSILAWLSNLTAKPDLMVLAGWMHIFSSNFLQNVGIPVINLHPALPGQFPGKDGIGEAFKAFQEGKITKTGCMIHYVIDELDAGKVICQCEVQVSAEDTLETLRARVTTIEKPLLLQGITQVLNELDDRQLAQEQLIKMSNKIGVSPEIYKNFNIRSGKVRDIWDVGYGLLAMVHSNRLSSFDRNICEIPHKGKVLTETSKWWFNHTRPIIPNHFVHAIDNVMFVKKCTVIPIEVVLRAYITGSTQTSLWTHYNRGERTYCGIQFPDGLVKNQKLDKVVITPTTKAEVDEPLSESEIYERQLCTPDEWMYISQKAMDLFQFGEEMANNAGLILVDTKLEFGRAPDGTIMLIDEIFTCDSSRWWIKDTYAELFAANKSPQSLDKDIIRDYVNTQCNPYTDELPPIPMELIQRVEHTYLNFYQRLTNENLNINNENSLIKNIPSTIDTYFNRVHSPLVIVLSGSIRDQKHVSQIQEALREKKIYSYWKACSAHRETAELMSFLDDVNDEIEEGRRFVICCVAGRSNALGAVVSCNTTAPVISCPPFSSKDDYLINIHSSLQNPCNVPVMVCLEPVNCAQFILNMFKLGNLM